MEFTILQVELQRALLPPPSEGHSRGARYRIDLLLRSAPDSQMKRISPYAFSARGSSRERERFTIPFQRVCAEVIILNQRLEAGQFAASRMICGIFLLILAGGWSRMARAWGPDRHILINRVALKHLPSSMTLSQSQIYH